MPVFEGVLTYVAGGSSVGAPSQAYDRDGYAVGPSAVSQAAFRGVNVTTRQFIEIGGQRLDQVQLTNYHDELIQRYIGESIAISAIRGGNGWIVKSIGLPDGSVNKVPSSSAGCSIVSVGIASAVPIIFFAVLALIGLAVNFFILTIIGLLGAGFFLWMIYKTSRVALAGNNELDNWRPGMYLGQGQMNQGQMSQGPMNQGQPSASTNQAPQAPAPPPVSSDWQVTHIVPAGGMRAWSNPDGTVPPAAMLQPGVELHLRESLGAWAKVEGRNGWVGWVDGNLLQAAPPPPPGS